MKKLMIVAVFAAVAAFFAGCGNPGKVRDIDLKGMYINGYTETLAIGQGKLTSIPGEREAMAAHYREDTAWLSPTTKTHELDIFLVGSNTVSNSAGIVESICKAFSDVAPTISSNNAVSASGATAFDVLSAAGRQNAERAATKVSTAATNAMATAASTTSAAGVPSKLKETIENYFLSRGGDISKARIYYDSNNVLTMTDGTVTVECADDGACRECGDK